MSTLQEQYQAVREGVGVADVSRDRHRVTGTDARRFLHGQCTNQINALGVGQSCYAAFLTAKGKMRGDANIVCLADALLVETDRAQVESLAASLEKFVITEDVVIQDVSDQLGELTLQGPRAPVLAERLTGAAVIVYPNSRDGQPGFDLIAAPAELPRLLRVGAENGAQLVGPEALEVWRVEAGLARFGVDMDTDTIPNEAGLASRAISYDKGCYIGQETIARIKTYGHVNRRLVQLAVAGTSVPRRGETIVVDGREVGQVTSAVLSIRLGKPLALGYVRREFANAGTSTRIATQNAEVIRLCGE